MKEKNRIPTLREMYQYISGKGSNASRHEMEKRLQKEPFMSDALDGLEKIGKSEATAQVEALNNIINKKKRRASPLVRLAIAAAVALLMVTTATLVFFKTWQETKEPTLTQAEKKEAKIIVEDFDVEDLEEEVVVEEATIEIVKPPKAKEVIVITDDFLELETEVAEEKGHFYIDLAQQQAVAELAATPAKPLDEPRAYNVSDDKLGVEAALAGRTAGVQTSTTQRTEPVITSVQPGQVLVDLAADAEKRREAATPEKPMRVRGVITDATTGDVIPFASINIKGTTDGAIADIDGSYDIPLKDQNQTTLVVSSVGYETQEVEVAGRQVVNVQVSADMVALQEFVVVGGYGTSKRETLSGSATHVKPVIKMAAPKKGVDDFEDYLERVAILDDTFPEHSAVVKVQFIVNRGGRPTRIRVVSSPSKDISERAKQILTEGPDWQPATKDGKFTRERVEYSIVFRKKDSSQK